MTRGTGRAVGWPRRAAAAGLAAAALAAGGAGCAPDPGRAGPPARPPLWGVTVDDTTALAAVTAALAALPEHPTARVYFDVRRPARYYAAAVGRISRVATVLGELLDSADEKAITVPAFAARVAAYLRVLRGHVAIWEIGNEVNGSWAGRYPVVAAKLSTAYDEVAAAGGATALTLYANEFGPDHCGDGPAELTPVQFTRRYVPARVARGLSYLFLSYYPAQCGGREPSSGQLARALRRLHALYPGARLGIGEVGLPAPVTAASLPRARQIMRWAYSLSPRLPYYVGGYFWWYAAEDALHPGAPLHAALPAAFRAEAAALARH